MTGDWASSLPPDQAAQLARLNPEPYLRHKKARIDAHLEAAAHLPSRWDAVEIGSNRGHFCRGLARSHPDWAILALEWRAKWVGKARAQAIEEGLTGLHSLRADARIALPLLAEPQSIERLFVLYPDPWWKKKHEHRRLLDTPFFEVVSDLLVPDGLLAIKTDVRLVRDDIVEACAQVTSLRAQWPAQWPDERAWPLSTRERTCLRNGTATYRLFWRRRTG